MTGARWCVVAWSGEHTVVLGPTHDQDAATRTAGRVRQVGRYSARVLPLLPLGATAAQLGAILGPRAARRPPWDQEQLP